jgi:hypothetical protein
MGFTLYKAFYIYVKDYINKEMVILKLILSNNSNPNYLPQDTQTAIYNQSSASSNLKLTLGIANLIGSE